jgi:hypothetical protein
MKQKVEFYPPDGFAPPEVEDGKFDLVCTFESRPDGSLCLTMLGDTPMPGYEGKGENGKPSYSKYTQDMQSALGEGEQT